MYHLPFFFGNCTKVRHEKRRIYPQNKTKNIQTVPKVLDFFWPTTQKNSTHQPTTQPKQEAHQPYRPPPYRLPYRIFHHQTAHQHPTTTNPVGNGHGHGRERKSLIPRFTASNATPKNVMEALRLQGAREPRRGWLPKRVGRLRGVELWPGVEGEFLPNRFL